MCHRVGDEGGSVGPDLTAIASRFSRRDILESIIEPSKVISEQYANTEIVLKNGTTIIGRVVSDDGDKLLVRPSMLAPDMQEISEGRHQVARILEDFADAAGPAEHADERGNPRSARLFRSGRPRRWRAVQEVARRGGSMQSSAQRE